MVDVDRPGREFERNMLNEKIAIGRTWKAMPTYVRVTVGTPDEMAKFQTAFVKCMDMPVKSPAMAFSPESDRTFRPSWSTAGGLRSTGRCCGIARALERSTSLSQVLVKIRMSADAAGVR